MYPEGFIPDPEGFQEDQQAPEKTFVEKVAGATPAIGSTLGALGGGIAGTALFPGAGTAAGAGFGAGAGYGAGKAIEENILKLAGKYNAPTTAAGVVEDVMKPVNVGLSTAVTGKVMEKGSQLVKNLVRFPEIASAKSMAAAKNKPFSQNKYLDAILKASEKYSGKEQENFLKLAFKEADTTIDDAAKALEIRKNIKPASFLKKTLLGESTKDKFNVAKYSALNEQLKKIPEVAKYDKQIRNYLKVRDYVGKPLAGYLLSKTGIPREIFQAVTGLGK